MNRPWQLRGLHYFGPVVAVVVAMTTQSAALPGENEKWFRVVTPSFVVISNAKEGQVKELLEQLERFRAVVQQDKSASGPPTTILAFKNNRSYEDYRRKNDREVEGVTGLFFETREGAYISLDLDTSEAAGTIYHEFTHYLLSRTAYYIPLWVHEGRADFYSTFTADEERAEIGRPIEDYVQLLHKATKLMPLEELFGINVDSPVYNEGARRTLFYAQSWLLYHYWMMQGDETRTQFGQFLDLLQDGQVSTAAAFHTVFGFGYDKLESDLHHYVRNPAFAFERHDIRHVSVEGAARPERLDRAELLFVLGDYLARATKSDFDAEVHLRAALREQPLHARAHAVLAGIRARQQHFDEADTHYKLAIEHGRNDYLPFFAFGISKVDSFRASDPTFKIRPTRLPSMLLEARGLLGRCLELNPELAEAYVGLAVTYLFDPEDNAQAIWALQQAISRMPARMDVVYLQVLAYLQQGDQATAQGLVENVLSRSRESVWRRRGQEALKDHARYVEFDRYTEAVKLFNDGEYTKAITLVDQLLAETHDIVMKRDLQKLRERATNAKNIHDQFDRYNDAVDLANDGKLDAAIAILREISEDPANDRIKELSDDLIAELRAAKSARRRR